MSVTHPTAFRNAVATMVEDNTPGGSLVFRASPSTAASPGAEIATLTLATPSFGSPTNGTITAGTITQDSNATGGTVAFATIDSSGAVTQVHCSVAASGQDIDFSGGLVVGAGDIVSCSSLTYTAMP